MVLPGSASRMLSPRRHGPFRVPAPDRYSAPVAEWSPEVDVDAGRARSLIRGQFPDVPARSLRLLAEGWDTVLWLVDETVLFRFPRRAIVVPGLEREMDLLPRLARYLPVPVPAPCFLGRPTEGYPWPFFGGRLLPGVEVSDAAMGNAARRRLAPQLGRFLAALHAPGLATVVKAADQLPIDPLGRADMARRVPRTFEALAEVRQLELWTWPPSVDRLLDSARRLGEAAGPEAIVHGDLHFRQLLVDGTGALCGVIDWIDVCRGPRCIDLQLFWSLLPVEARGAFLDAYGAVTEEELLCARVLALFLCAVLAAYGHHERMPNVKREAIEGLERAATG